MQNFLLLNILDNKKDENVKTNLVFIKRVDIKDLRSIISFNNLVI